MKSKISILYIIPIITIIILSIFIINQINSIKIKVSYKEVKEKNIKNKTEIKNENIVLLGDSITEIYPIDDIFGELPIIKSGVSGYTTEDILERIESMVYRYNPTKIFILIGTNDYLYVKTNPNEEIYNNIKKIITNIKTNRKKAKIYLESVYPVNRNMEKNMVKDRSNETIIELNNKLKEYCNDNDVTFINTYPELLDEDGNFDKKYTYDGLHPSTLGYAKITRLLLPYIYGIE